MLLVGRTFLILILVSLLSGVSQAAQPFRVGVVNGGPHVLVERDAKVPTGMAPEFFQKYVFPEITKKFNLAIQWDLSPTSRLFRGISKGDLDMMFMVIKTPEREKVYSYSAEPFFYDRAGLIVAKDFSTLNGAISPEQLRGKVVGQMVGTLIPEIFKEYQVKSYELSGDDIGNRLISLVGAKRIDAVFVHFISVAEYILKANHLQDSLKAVPLSTEVPPFEAYVIFKKNIDPAIKKEIEELIRKNRKHYPQKMHSN